MNSPFVKKFCEAVDNKNCFHRLSHVFHRLFHREGKQNKQEVGKKPDIISVNGILPQNPLRNPNENGFSFSWVFWVFTQSKMPFFEKDFLRSFRRGMGQGCG